MKRSPYSERERLMMAVFLCWFIVINGAMIYWMLTCAPCR